MGKVNFMQIAPMTFEEFLLANGDDNLLTFLKSRDCLAPYEVDLLLEYYTSHFALRVFVIFYNLIDI